VDVCRAAAQLPGHVHAAVLQRRQRLPRVRRDLQSAEHELRRSRELVLLPRDVLGRLAGTDVRWHVLDPEHHLHHRRRSMLVRRIVSGARRQTIARSSITIVGCQL
jgi:hypothetical protein